MDEFVFEAATVIFVVFMSGQSGLVCFKSDQLCGQNALCSLSDISHLCLCSPASLPGDCAPVPREQLRSALSLRRRSGRRRGQTPGARGSQPAGPSSVHPSSRSPVCCWIAESVALGPCFAVRSVGIGWSRLWLSTEAQVPAWRGPFLPLYLFLTVENQRRGLPWQEQWSRLGSSAIQREVTSADAPARAAVGGAQDPPCRRRQARRPRKTGDSSGPQQEEQEQERLWVAGRWLLGWVGPLSSGS